MRIEKKVKSVRFLFPGWSCVWKADIWLKKVTEEREREGREWKGIVNPQSAIGVEREREWRDKRRASKKAIFSIKEDDRKQKKSRWRSAEKAQCPEILATSLSLSHRDPKTPFFSFYLFNTSETQLRFLSVLLSISVILKLSCKTHIPFSSVLLFACGKLKNLIAEIPTNPN